MQRLVHCGNTLLPENILSDSGIQPCALLEILPRLCGGGGDGGSTGAESRSSYLEMYRGKQPDKVNPEEERLAKWTACRLSGMPLQPPCAADELGNLFNKEVVVQALLAKNMPRSLGHITSMKQLIDVKLEEAKGAASDSAVRFVCPVNGAPMSGKFKFVLVKKDGKGTGYVVSERAIKELPAIVKEIVGGDWTREDIIPIYPQGDELEQRQAAVTARREAELAAKLEKKAAKAAAKGVNNNGGNNNNNHKRAVAALGNGDEGKKNGVSNGGVHHNGVDPPPAAKRVKGAAEELMPAHADPKVWNSLFTDKNKKEEVGENGRKKNTDYMVRGGLKYVV